MKKLRLKKVTLRDLDDSKLNNVAGGTGTLYVTCTTCDPDNRCGSYYSACGTCNTCYGQSCFDGTYTGCTGC
jgi:hypothetical protein